MKEVWKSEIPYMLARSTQPIRIMHATKPPVEFYAYSFALYLLYLPSNLAYVELERVDMSGDSLRNFL